jgi:hypothetical protein
MIDALELFALYGYKKLHFLQLSGAPELTKKGPANG